MPGQEETLNQTLEKQAGLIPAGAPGNGATKPYDRSESIVKLAVAFSLCQKEIKTATKSKENPFFHSKYADLDEVWSVCRDPLTKNGLSIVQTVDSKGQMVSVTTILLHNSGEFISSTLTLQADNAKPQPIGSAITYARRYSLSAMVGISADEDTDGNDKKVTTEVKGLNSRLPQSLQKQILAAQKRIGNEQFAKAIGEIGYTSWEEIAKVEEAQDLLKTLATYTPQHAR